MATVEDWSSLPKELLDLISKRIDTEIDLIRFRSVCTHWRSSSIPNHSDISQLKVPLFEHPFNNDDTVPAFFCHLSKRSFFLIKPPQQENQEQQPWLIRITQTSTGTLKLYQRGFHVLDFNNLSVLHLGCEFHVEDSRPYLSNLQLPKSVSVVTSLGKKPLALIMLKNHPFMLLFRRSFQDFFSFPNVSTSVLYTCVFKQRIYQVFRNGWLNTVELEEDPNVQVAAEPLVDSGNLKFLVESEGDLLLIDIDDGNIKLKICVFRLDEMERKWVKLENLGDRVLFIGLEHSFSLSVSDLHVPRGNCIIFMDDVFDHIHMEEMSIVHLDQDGYLSFLYVHPEYCNLFWPPPEWIIKSHTH